jgi:hypothetical protein
MKPKPLLPPPPEVSEYVEDTHIGSFGGEILEDYTVCKHGKGDCEKCGTTNKRDVVHTTRGGVEVVGALRRK